VCSGVWKSGRLASPPEAIGGHRAAGTGAWSLKYSEMRLLPGLLIHKIRKEGTFFTEIVLKLFPSRRGHLVPM